MANNCLVTKLKATVDADIDYLNTMTIQVKHDSSKTNDAYKMSIRPITNKTLKIFSNKDTFSIDDGTTWITEIEISDTSHNTRILFKNDKDYKVFIFDKANIHTISSIETTLASFYINIDYIAEPVYMTGRYLKFIGNWNTIDGSVLYQIVANSYDDAKNYVDLDTLSWARTINNCEILKNAKGNIIAFGTNKSITYMKFTSPEVTGSLEELGQSMATAGKTSTIRCDLIGTSVTYNGVAVDHLYNITFSSGSYTITPL